MKDRSPEAFLKSHGKVIKKWRVKGAHTTYHLTESNWLLGVAQRRDGQIVMMVVARPEELMIRDMWLTRLDDPKRNYEPILDDNPEGR